MAKKFAKINGLFNVFVLKTDNNTQYYDPAKIIKGVVDIDKNTICFVSATAGDVDKKIGEYTIKENDRFVITQGGIYAYTGKQYSEPVIPDTPDTPIEDTWRPIYINSTPINELEYTKNNEYGDTVTIKPIKPALDFTTPKTTYEVNGIEYGILKIDDSYDDIYDIVSMEFGVDYNELKRFIEAVLHSKENIGNGNLAINVNGTNSVNFTANQTTDSEINLVNGDNIKITTETTKEGDKIKISAQVETPKNGKLSFILGDENFETEDTLVEFSANQESDTSIKFLAGDNITLEGTTGQLKISGSEQRTYTTADIMFANEIKIGGTKLGDIIAAENIFPDDKITTDMSLQFVLETILSGISTSEEWGIQEVLAELKPSNDTKIKITAKNYYTGEEIDLNKPLIELEADTTILVTYTIEDPKVYQTVKVSPFVGGYALENTESELEDVPSEPVALMSEDEVSPDTPLEPGETTDPIDPENPEIDMDQDNPTIPMYKEFIGDTEYLRIFDGATYTFDDYQNPSFDGFTKVSAADIGNNEIVLKVNEGWNNLSIKRSWSITPELNFNPYYIYPISNRGNIGLDRGIEISNSLFFDLAKIGTLESKLQIRGVAKELLPYYIGIVNNFENIFDFSDGQEISSESLVSNTENGIRIEKQDTEAPKIIEPTTYTDDLQLFIAVPANQFSSTDWIVSVVNTAAFNDNVTELDDIDFKSEKLSITIDDKPYYLWYIKGKYADCIFRSNVYKITLNK